MITIKRDSITRIDISEKLSPNLNGCFEYRLSQKIYMSENQADCGKCIFGICNVAVDAKPFTYGTQMINIGTNNV